MVKFSSSPICAAYSRSSRAPMPWKVPAQGSAGGRSDFRPEHACQHLARAALHFLRGAAREGQQQHALRIDATGDEVRHAVRQRAGLAGAGAGNHQQRAVIVPPQRRRRARPPRAGRR
jgi:hypothetical protein